MDSIGAIQEGIQLYLREVALYIMLVQVICTMVVLAAVIYWGRE